MTPRKWVLLILPVTIAFIVGGFAPTLVGKPFNLLGAVIWGGFILIIDYNFVVIEKMSRLGWLARIVLVLASALITASVGDHLIFKDDIEVNETGFKSPKKIELEQQVKEQDAIYARAVLIRDCECSGGTESICAGLPVSHNPGKGPLCDSKTVDMEYERDRLNELREELNSIKGKTPIIHEMKALYSFVFSNGVSATLFIVFMLMILAIETLPLTLKDGKTAYDLDEIRKKHEAALNRIRKQKHNEWML